MDHAFRCGAVAALDGIVHAISVARAVMERTEHILLAGHGALEFALVNGFARENLVVAETMCRFEEIVPVADASSDSPAGSSNSADVARPNFENHDTIVTLALDTRGRLAGGCSTSGLMNRVPGRVGDSPIVGAGLYVDGEIGAAGATGHGELALRISASALVVERMRAGASAQVACEQIVHLIRMRLHPDEDQQLALLALGADGSIGAAALRPGFSYAVSHADTHETIRVAALH